MKGLPKKGEGGGGLGQFANLGGGLGEKEGMVFLRGRLIPQCTLWRNDKAYINENDNFVMACIEYIFTIVL